MVLEIKPNAIGKYISTEKYNFYATAFSLFLKPLDATKRVVLLRNLCFTSDLHEDAGRWTAYMLSVVIILDICFALQ